MNQPGVLIPTEQRSIDFYGDELVVVSLDGQPYVPIRPICDFLGLSWSGQSERIKRDAVLLEVAATVRVTRMEGERAVSRELLCLPIDYLNGWLFGVNAIRVKDTLRERLIRYQKDCYRALSRAFQSVDTADVSPLTHIRDMAMAIANMAEQQMLLEGRMSSTEARLDKAAVVVGDLSKRLGRLESRLAPGSHITDEQAAEVSQRVKALAAVLQEQDPGKNYYQSIFGELYRQFGVSSYRLIRQNQFSQVLAFLDDWRGK